MKPTNSSSKKNIIDCITKTIFRCKNSKRNRNDYTFVSYDRISNNQDSQNRSNISSQSGPRAMSTMIQTASNSFEYQLFPSKSDLHFNFEKSDVSLYISEEQLLDQFQSAEESTLHHSDLEITRRQSVNSVTTCDTVEIPCSNQISPISFKTLCPSTSVETVEYLQSTELSNDIFNYQDMSSNLEFTLPFFQSSSLSHKSSEENDFKIKFIDTMIQNLSLSDSSPSTCATHVIITDYDATFVGDLTVNLSDTVCILKDDNHEWIQVQVTKSGLVGFVPRTAVLEINQFVTQLKVHRESLLNASSFNTQPIHV